MTNLNVKRYIEENLKSKYIKDNNEWIDVHIDAQNFIDIKIISNHIISRKELKSNVLNLMEVITDYKLGMIRTYSTDEAEEYEIIKSKKQNKPSSLVEVIDYINNEYEISNKKKQFNSEVISFYSYKGGVGRTLSLIHTAYLLAQRGKNVLMLDLDIEAPSLQNIFKTEVSNLRYGLIDYIYNKIYEKGTDKDVQITDIYTRIEGSKNENFSGNLYVLPSGRLNKEYIYKLSKVQPSLVSRDNYISNLIKELESKHELNLDFVLVDSRTGINDWGALSLVDISDRVIFFIYPNNENIEGSIELINLVNQLKDGNMSIVFSRVDPKARERARMLYEELDLNQEYIEVLYDSSITISEKFPIQKMLENCEPIVDMIQEPENLRFNIKYLHMLNLSEKKSTLEELKKGFEKKDIVKNDIININKIEEENIYLIISKSQDILNQYIKSIPKKTMTISVERNEVKRYHFTKIVDKNIFNSLTVYLEQYTWLEIWHSYIIKMINDYNSAIKELVNKSCRYYLEYLKHNDIIKVYKTILDTQIEKDRAEMNNIELKSFFRETDNIYSKLSILINNLKCLDHKIMSSCLEELKSIMSFFEKNSINVQVKIFTQDDENLNKNYIFNEFKSNILNLEWKKGDIKRLIIDTLSKVDVQIFKSYKDLLNADTNKKNDLILDLFWGKKVIINNKKINTLDYFCEKLEEINKFNIIDAIDILKNAIEIEINNEFTNADDRIISQSSIEKALKK